MAHLKYVVRWRQAVPQTHTLHVQIEDADATVSYSDAIRSLFRVAADRVSSFLIDAQSSARPIDHQLAYPNLGRHAELRYISNQHGSRLVFCVAENPDGKVWKGRRELEWFSILEDSLLQPGSLCNRFGGLEFHEPVQVVALDAYGKIITEGSGVDLNRIITTCDKRKHAPVSCPDCNGTGLYKGEDICKRCKGWGNTVQEA